MMLGTPSYMSPEQATGKNDLVGPPTDVWAMGVILYEMATQQVAFRGEGIEPTLAMITGAEPYPIGMLRADVPRALAQLIERAIVKDPTQRIQTIEELREGLRTALAPRSTPRLNTPVAGIPLLAPLVKTPAAAASPVTIHPPATSGVRRWLIIGAFIAAATVANLVIALVT